MGAELASYDVEMLLEFNQVFGVFSAPMHAAIVGCISISLQPVKHNHDVCAFSRRGYVQRATSISDMRFLLEKYPSFNCRNLVRKLNGSNARLLQLIHEAAASVVHDTERYQDNHSLLNELLLQVFESLDSIISFNRSILRFS